MANRALIIGGCPAPYHRLEGFAPPVKSALEALGLHVTVTGITHPEGGEAWKGDYSALTETGLHEYDLLVLNTTGNTRYEGDETEIMEWVEEGGALVGIHNATDSFTDNPEWVRFMGGRFRHHPAQLDIATEITDRSHPITRGLDDFTVHDELYLFADFNPAGVHLLAQTHSYDDNGPVPIAWVKEPASGRLFYLSLGHNVSTLEDAHWQTFFKNGVEWALRRR